MIKLAEIKFNNGRGALLCNHCRVIIATGIDHVDKIHLCEDCKKITTEEKVLKELDTPVD